MDNINKTICSSDNDCDKNNICSFNEDDLNHYCINNDKSNLYLGCLNNNIKNLDYIESKTISDHSDFKNCIDFTRRQKNKDGYLYNYMIYKPKKNIFVDTNTINIYLKCNEEILSVIPYNDYFNLKCDDLQENCVLESNKSLLNFIVQNTKNCNGKIYLEVVYECENEKLKNHEKINIDIDNFNDIKINLRCPVNQEDDKFKSKCDALFFNNDEINEGTINKSINMYNCNNPVYNIPRIVSDKNIYKKLKDNNTKDEIKNYDNKINQKIEDLKKLKAEKYIKLRKIQTGESITYEEAYQIVNKYSSKKLIDNSSEYWTLFNNYDAAQYLYNDKNNSSILKFFGKVYTIDEAKKVADENNQSFFVWYHNSYELDDFASKLYFIDIYNIENDLFDKSNWAKNENVTTAILNFETYDNDNDDDNWHETGIGPNTNANSKKITKLINTSIENTEIMKNKYIELLNNIPNYNVNMGVIDNLNSKITTYGQAISMNNYETNINNNILIVIFFILAVIFIIFVAVLVYFNHKTAGKV
jgi:hypothetical protein